MDQGSMLIDHCSRLCTAVPVRHVEIERGDGMLAEGAFECGAAVHRLGGVISHTFIVVLLKARVLGQWVCNFRAENALYMGNWRSKFLATHTIEPDPHVCKVERC